jgi:hypothetical protein
MLWEDVNQQWKFRKLTGGSWSNVKKVDAQTFNSNTYADVRSR